MSVMRSHVLQAKDSLRQATTLVDNLEQDNPELQELKNAAKQASQAAEVLNRLVGTRMATSAK
jgi:hypothetical protein